MQANASRSGVWEVTYLPAGVRGTFWYLYSVIDVWSRKLVASVVHDVQSDDLAAVLVGEACRRECVEPGRLMLHSDNGAAMTGKTMLVKLEELGVVPSFSRPRVSDDNPFPEALFRTMYTGPATPTGRSAPSRTRDAGSPASPPGTTTTTSTVAFAS
jgi:putative transposase